MCCSYRTGDFCMDFVSAFAADTLTAVPLTSIATDERSQ
jgi:hypothetical protein